MQTYTNILSGYQTWTDTSAANLVKGKELINDSVRTICNLQGGKLRFLEATKDMDTVASQSAYQIPNKFRKLISVIVYSGTGTSTDTIYTPEMVFDPIRWNQIQQARLGESDVPYFTYVENQKYYLYPTPATSSHKITLRGRLNVRDLGIADYTTGTVVSIANQGTALVGSGTTWTADMVGRFIQINQTTAANGGDGFWYEIGAYVSATALTLLKPYEGTAISAGSATYTIGQVPPIPEAYQTAILYRACALYWEDKGDMEKAKRYWLRYDGGNEAGYNNGYGGLIGQMLDNEGETEEGAYIPPFGTSSVLPQAPYYESYQQASGF